MMVEAAGVGTFGCWALVAGEVGQAADSLVLVSLGSVDLDSLGSEGVVLESVVHQSVGL